MPPDGPAVDGGSVRCSTHVVIGLPATTPSAATAAERTTTHAWAGGWRVRPPAYMIAPGTAGRRGGGERPGRCRHWANVASAKAMAVTITAASHHQVSALTRARPL